MLKCVPFSHFQKKFEAFDEKCIRANSFNKRKFTLWQYFKLNNKTYFVPLFTKKTFTCFETNTILVRIQIIIKNNEISIEKYKQNITSVFELRLGMPEISEWKCPPDLSIRRNR